MLCRGEVDLVKIMEEEVQTALKRMKKGRVPSIDEVCTEMLIAVGEAGGLEDDEAVEYTF